MKIAYQEKNIIEAQGTEWERCDGCIFNMEEITVDKIDVPTIWPCDLFNPDCKGYDIYQQLTELDKIFKI